MTVRELTDLDGALLGRVVVRARLAPADHASVRRLDLEICAPDGRALDRPCGLGIKLGVLAQQRVMAVSGRSPAGS
jgi:hypothetical protein